MSEQPSFFSVMKDQLVIPAVFFKKYHALGLKEEEALLILQIHRFQMEGNEFPTPGELAEVVSMSEQVCSQILRKLIQKNLLWIEQKSSKENVLGEFYSLEPLWNSLYSVPASDGEENQKDQQEGTNLFLLFEQEFGRPLSPFEIETINIWLDEEKQSPALIKAALREAVLMGKLNFKYIDRILGEWKRKGIHSVQQARKQSRPFHANQNNQNNQGKKKASGRDTSLYYNWLEEE